LCRVFGQRGDPRCGPTKKWLWATAEEILPRRQVGDFNQAVMGLGALICTPKAPRCSACPIAVGCKAHRVGLVEKIPKLSSPPKTVEVREVAVVVRHCNRVLLVQRPDHGRWAGMWEFPHGVVEKGESNAETARRVVGSLTGLRISSLKE